MGTAREKSRQDWGCENQQELLNLGCLQRIADATEAMAQRHTELMADRDRYKRLYEASRKREDTLERRNAGLRGYITRLKHSVAKLGGKHECNARM